MGAGSDLELLRRTFALARDALNEGNHPFGALLVLEDAVRLVARNTTVVDRDATRHAELSLVSHATRLFAREELARASLYSSTEPCPMCAGAIYQAGIGRLVYGCSGAGLRDLIGAGSTIPCREILERAGRRVEVMGPLLETEGLALHASAAWWEHATKEAR